jgi:hypothetical protein
MKLYTGKIPTIAEELIRSLTALDQDGQPGIEVADVNEAQLDVEAVLKEYVRMDRECTDKAKDVMEQRSLPYAQFGKIKRAIADEKGFVLGEEATGYIAGQILETFMHSAHIEEVYADDVTLRKKVKEVLAKHMKVDEELDEEVRRRIKNLQEGTQSWELEYAKVMDQIKRKHGLNEP